MPASAAGAPGPACAWAAATGPVVVGSAATGTPPTWLQEKYALLPVYEFSEAEADLLRELLQVDPDARLGGRTRPAQPFLRQHRFFAGLDWDRVARKLDPPPFVPSQRINAASQRQLQRRDGGGGVTPSPGRASPITLGGRHGESGGGGGRGRTTQRTVSGAGPLVPVPMCDVDGWDYVCPEAYQRELVQLLQASSASGDDGSGSGTAARRAAGSTPSPAGRRKGTGTVNTGCHCGVM